MKMNIWDLCIGDHENVRLAMSQMDQTAKKIIFVVKGKVLCASLTDGDIRRFLLAGNSMDENVMKCANINYRKADTRAAAYEILKKQPLGCMPVVSAAGELVDVVFADEKLELPKEPLRLPVVIMAGGEGTRLEPFTKVLPKPLIPVGNLPIVEHIMKQFEKYSCIDFHMIVNYKRQLIKAYFAESGDGYTINYYDEDIPLGTGGGLHMLKGRVDSTFFLTNCDILIDAEYNDILNFHRSQANVITMVCAYRHLTIPYGVVDIGINGSIENMREKPEFTFLTNTGMYLVEPEVLADIEDGVAIGFPDIIDMQKNKGKKVAVYPISESCWMDMGQLRELDKMREKLYGSI